MANDGNGRLTKLILSIGGGLLLISLSIVGWAFGTFFTNLSTSIQVLEASSKEQTRQLIIIDQTLKNVIGGLLSRIHEKIEQNVRDINRIEDKVEDESEKVREMKKNKIEEKQDKVLHE